MVPGTDATAARKSASVNSRSSNFHWEVFEIDYDAGRAQYILRGVNRCGTALETFTWQGAPWPGSRPDHSRFGFRYARVLDERGLRVLRACGFPL